MFLSSWSAVKQVHSSKVPISHKGNIYAFCLPLYIWNDFLTPFSVAINTGTNGSGSQLKPPKDLLLLYHYLVATWKTFLSGTSPDLHTECGTAFLLTWRDISGLVISKGCWCKHWLKVKVEGHSSSHLHIFLLLVGVHSNGNVFKHEESFVHSGHSHRCCWFLIADCYNVAVPDCREFEGIILSWTIASFER